MPMSEDLDSIPVREREITFLYFCLFRDGPQGARGGSGDKAWMFRKLVATYR